MVTYDSIIIKCVLYFKKIAEVDSTSYLVMFFTGTCVNGKSCGVAIGRGADNDFEGMIGRVSSSLHSPYLRYCW